MRIYQCIFEAIAKKQQFTFGSIDRVDATFTFELEDVPHLDCVVTLVLLQAFETSGGLTSLAEVVLLHVVLMTSASHVAKGVVNVRILKSQKFLRRLVVVRRR